MSREFTIGPTGQAFDSPGRNPGTVFANQPSPNEAILACFAGKQGRPDWGLWYFYVIKFPGLS